MNLHEMQILLCGVRRAKIGRGFDQTTLSLFVLFAFVQSRKLFLVREGIENSLMFIPFPFAVFSLRLQFVFRFLFCMIKRNRSRVSKSKPARPAFL